MAFRAPRTGTRPDAAWTPDCCGRKSGAPLEGVPCPGPCSRPARPPASGEALRERRLLFPGRQGMEKGRAELRPGRHQLLAAARRLSTPEPAADQARGRSRVPTPPGRSEGGRSTGASPAAPARALARGPRSAVAALRARAKKGPADPGAACPLQKPWRRLLPRPRTLPPRSPGAAVLSPPVTPASSPHPG